MTGTHKPVYIKWENEVSPLGNMETDLKRQIPGFDPSLIIDGDVKFEDLFSINEIQLIQDEFAKTTGVASIITDPQGRYITKPSNFCRLCSDIIRKTSDGLANCIKSDIHMGRYHPEGPIIEKCKSCGLWDGGTSIIVEGKHIANWLIGQVRDESQTEEMMSRYARKMGLDNQQVLEAFREVPVMSQEKLSEISNILFLFANQLSRTAYQNLKQNHLINMMKETEESLFTSEQEIQSIFRAAPAGIGVIKDRVLQKVNKRFCEMLGYSQEELINKNARLLYPDEETYLYVGKEKYAQIKKKGTGTVETRFQCKDGKIIDILLSSTPLDLKDLSKGVTFTVLDITDLKQKELELMESEKKYRSMMEAMDDPAYIYSSDYKIEYMNPAMIKRTGRNAIGDPCYHVIHGLKEICPWCVFDRVLKRETVKHEVLSPKDNRTYNISYSPIFHVNNRVSMLTIFRDITDLKQLQANLQQAQKMESIGTLAGGIAHDFNNILSPIFGYIELTLEELPKESHCHSYLVEALNAAHRASDLIKQILTFSRNTEHELKPLNPHLVINEALKLLRASIPSTIVINHDISKKGGLIMANPIHIHQIVMNLCTNAFHAMEKDGGVLTVTLAEVELTPESLGLPDNSPGKYLCLTVIDTGEGMEPQVMARIFDPYFTTKSNEKGTGLGLSIIHGIVRDYGGTIKVHSEPEKGTEFKIYFPVNPMEPWLKERSHEPPLEYGHEHILLIDDEYAIAEMEREMLESLGYQVTVRTNSQEALDLFRKEPEIFNLVITDQTMPHLTGEKLAKEMIRIRSDIPIILCTGYLESNTENLKALGIKALLMKPIPMKELSRKIREVLSE